MTYDFRAPQGGSFSSLFLHDNDSDASKFFDVDHEKTSHYFDQEISYSGDDPTITHETIKEVIFDKSITEVQCSTPLNDDKSGSHTETLYKGSNVLCSPYQDEQICHQSTPICAYLTPTGGTPNQLRCEIQTATPCIRTLNKTRSVDRPRRRSSSCPGNSGTQLQLELDREKEATLSEALQMLSVSGSTTNTALSRGSSSDEMQISTNIGSHCTLSGKLQNQLQSEPQDLKMRKQWSTVASQECILRGNNRSKRKHSPPPPNGRDYSLPPQKYISMAEYIVKLQKQTPLRFRTRPMGDGNMKKDFPVCPPKPRVTIPKTPAFKSHLRSRPTNAISQDEKEKLELEEIRKNQFKAKPLKENVIHPPKLGVRVECRPVTKVKPFKLTEFKPKEVQKDEVKIFKARPMPKSIYKATPKVAEPLENVPEAPHQLVNVVGLKMETAKPHHPQNLKLKNGCERRVPHNIVLKPFSFEARDMEMKKKKEERLKELEKLDKQVKGFHANPAPCYPEPKNLRTTLKAAQAGHVHTTNNRQHRRHKSLDGLDQCDALLFRARRATVLHKDPFIPKKPERAPVKSKAFTLSTELRAKEREEFDQRVKEHELELEALRKQKEEEEQRKLEEEVSLLRKQLVHKPLPLPKYSNFEVKKSEKLLTNPHTPAFSRRPKNSKSKHGTEMVTNASETMETD